MVAPSIGDMFMCAFRCTDAHQFWGFFYHIKSVSGNRIEENRFYEIIYSEQFIQ